MAALKARYYTADGEKGSERSLPEILFDGEVNEAVLHRAVTAYLTNRRQGTASTKTRSEVRGGSRKPWRQKGTGRARHGTIRSPIWEGGGITFGPKPKRYRKRLPRKVKALARRSALNDRAADGRIVLLDALDLEEPKTRRIRELLEGMDVRDERVLLLTDGVKKVVYLSARNLPDVEVRPFGEETAYDILRASTVVIERSAVERAAEEAEAAAAEKAERDRERGRDLRPRRTAPRTPEVEEAPAAEEAPAPEAAAEEEEPAAIEEEEPEAAEEEEPEEPEAAAGPTPLPEDFPGHRPLTAAGIETVEGVRALEDLQDVKGIGPKTAEAIEEALAEIDAEDEDA